MLPTFNVRKTLSRSVNAEPEDVLKIKSVLSGLGHYKPPKWGLTPYPDRGMFGAVEDFQRKNKLKVDGVLKPGGPTEKKLNKNLARGIAPGEWDWMMQSGPLGKGNGIKDKPKPVAISLLNAADTTEKKNVSEQETQERADGNRVALGPGAILLPPLIAGTARVAPKVMRELGRLYGAAEAARKLDEAAKGKGSKTKTAPRSSITQPLPPLPPTEPPKEKDKLPQKEEFPANAPVSPNRMENIPPIIDTDLEVFPELDEELRKLGSIIERKGNEETRQGTTGAAGVMTEAGDEEDVPIAHIGGGRDKNGHEIKETLLRAPGETKSMKDGSWLDVTGEAENGRRIHLNTYDTRADGVTPTGREYRAAVRIMRNKKNGDIFVMIPKPRKGETINFKLLKQYLRPLVRELKKPAVKLKPGERWHQWKNK